MQEQTLSGTGRAVPLGSEAAFVSGMEVLGDFGAGDGDFDVLCTVLSVGMYFFFGSDLLC